MTSNITISPLQLLISIFILISLNILPPPFSNGLVAKPGCLDKCGDLKIPYPFGVGSSCSFDSSFDITCKGSAAAPKAYLSVIDKEVIELNDTYIRVKYHNLVSACYDLSGMNATGMSYKQSMSMNLSGTPYTLGENNVITAIGCDDMVMQSNGSWVSGGCSAFCSDNMNKSSFGYCTRNDSSLLSGCCLAKIYRDLDGINDFVAAELIDLSGNLGRRKLFPCSYAFIQERNNGFVFSYPLHYLDNSTVFLNDNWASSPNPPVVTLGSENCSRAQLNSISYACQDNKSICVDSSYWKGYLCECVEGYEGNPYLSGGCQAISFSSSSIAKPGCQDQCGELSIPFPFGIGPNCYLDSSFEIICNASTNPPIAYLHIFMARIIKLTNSSQVHIYYPNSTGLACYNLSDYQHGITKTEEQRLIIDLSETQYTFSHHNWITAIGCDDLVVGIVQQANQRYSSSICSPTCWAADTSVSCTSNYEPGSGCCNAFIPRGTIYLEANLSDISRQQKHRKFFSCSLVFLNYYYIDDDTVYGFPINYMNSSIRMFKDYNWPSGRGEVMLDWRIGQVNCHEARQNLSNFACLENSECVDFDSEIGGYLCNCSEGYQGNPYITSGCQDIDECADNTTDGRKDGTGCIRRPQAKTKMIILTGVGSGFGFLLILLVVFWSYKMWQKRKDRLLKEKFFKRNGGLLLQQQTNEGVLGKTKVFPTKELMVATDNFNESRIIGQGGQGTVYKGMLSDGTIVAIKKSKLVEVNHVEQFINEVAILSQINHRNVVKLLGCCLETEVPLLVYEFMPNGTLFDLIHDPNSEFPFTWNMRVKIAADIAGALAYLHSASSMPIYHRDIKSSNLLLDEKYVVKVSDFGTSRSISMDQTHLTTMVKGTFGYLDPEYFQSSQFTEKSDVYSFGVVLAELLTGQKPISFDKTEDRGLASRFITSMEENTLDAILDSQVSKQARKEEVSLIATLAQRCLNLKGKMRPSMKEIARELESVRISQIPSSSKNRFEEVRDFDDLPTMVSDIEYTWTTSYKTATTSSSDTHPLMFST